MAHFAELNSDNIVVRVVVIGNEDILDDEGNESEEKGKLYCQYLFGGGTWIQTSYNSNFRKNFAGEGAEWRPDLDGFVLPRQFPSWVLNETTCRWEAPIPHPDGTGEGYVWDEENVQWVYVPPPEDMGSPDPLPDAKAPPATEEIEAPEHNYPVEEI